MSKTWFLLFVGIVTSNCLALDIVGAWKSECQNYADPNAGYVSIQPVDSFTNEGTAVLRVHAFDKKNCQGKEWDAEIIPCKYNLGKEIPQLPGTLELDLTCEYGGTQHWFEIVERKTETIRFGNKTGLTSANRPTELGNVFYHRAVVDEPTAR